MELIEDKKLEKLIFTGLLGLSAVIPLVVRPGLVDRTLLKDAVFFLGIGSMLMGSCFFGLKKGFNIDKQTYLLIGFLGLVAVSTWFSLHRETSILGAHRLWLAAPAYLVLAATYFLALQIKWDAARLRKLMVVMVSTAAGLSLFALLKFGLKLSSIGIVVQTDKARALFPGPNTFAFFLMAVFPLALRLALESGKSKVERALFGIGSILIFGANIIIFSRTGWVASIVILFAVLLVGKKKVAALALILVAVAVVPMLKGVDGTPADAKYYAARRLASIFDSSGLGQRSAMWQTAKDLTLDRPFTGYGPDTFSQALVRRETPDIAAFRNKPRTPHNFVFYISATLGLPALILIFTIFFRSIKAAWASGDYLKQTLGMSMIAMIILSQALIWHPYMMLPFWLFMAAVSPDKFFVRGPGTTMVRLAAIAAALLIIGWTGVVGVADRYYLLGTSSPDRGQAQAYLNQALAINPYVEDYWRSLFRKTRDKAPEERLLVVARAKHYYPLSEEPLLMEATVRSENREAAEALHLLEDALKIRPFYGEAHLLKARVLAHLGRYDEAYKELAVATEIKSAKSKSIRQTTREIYLLKRP